MITGCTLVHNRSDNITYEIRPASPQLRQRAELLYEQTINSYKFEPLFKENSFIQLCIAKGIIDRDYQDSLQDTKNKLDQAKIHLFNLGPREEQAKMVRKTIQKLKDSYNKQNEYLFKIKSHTLEGIARHAKDQYIFLNSIYLDNKLFIDTAYNSQIINYITKEIIKNILSDKQLRAFARSPEWRQIWNSKKYDVFENGISALNPEQVALVQFSELYDFAHQHEKQLPESLLEDDDKFDGWYLQEVENIKNKKKEEPQNKNDQYQEIFSVVNSAKEAQQVYDKNSADSRSIIKQRREAIKKSGKIADSDLPDVQSDFGMANNQALINKMKSN